jgi:hypothetical protein
MDPELIKSLASQGIFALLFGYLGHRTLKQADKDRERWDQMGVKMIEVMDKISQRLDK